MKIFQDYSILSSKINLPSTAILSNEIELYKSYLNQSIIALIFLISIWIWIAVSIFSTADLINNFVAWSLFFCVLAYFILTMIISLISNCASLIKLLRIHSDKNKIIDEDNNITHLDSIKEFTSNTNKGVLQINNEAKIGEPLLGSLY